MPIHPALIAMVVAAVGALQSGGSKPKPAAAAPVIREQTETQAPKVATDPSYRELLGRIIPGAPEFPPYPGATLVGSAERNKPGEPNEGYVFKWTTPDTAAMVMAWYQKRLPELGWTFVPPSDGATVEQTANIEKSKIRGTIDVEVDKEVTEIVVTLGHKR